MERKTPETVEERDEMLEFFAMPEPEPDGLIIRLGTDHIAEIEATPEAERVAGLKKRYFGEETTTLPEAELTIANAQAGVKTCATCGETKERTDFGGHGRSSDRLQSSCKACAAISREAGKPDHRPMVSSLAAIIMAEMGGLVNRITDLENENARLREEVKSAEAKAIEQTIGLLQARLL